MVHLEDILYIPSIIIFGGTGSGCTVAIMGRWGKEKKKGVMDVGSVMAGSTSVFAAWKWRCT